MVCTLQLLLKKLKTFIIIFFSICVDPRPQKFRVNFNCHETTQKKDILEMNNRNSDYNYTIDQSRLGLDKVLEIQTTTS